MNNYESILYLGNPKLFSHATYDDRNNGKTVRSSAVSCLMDVAKSSKKSKINYKIADFVENKKNKSKRKTKAKNKIYVDTNVSDVKDESEINDVSSARFMRSSRNFKNKKNSKDQLLLSTNASVNNENYSKDIYLKDLLTVQDLAVKLHVPSADIIKWLFLQGISVTINQLLDVSISSLVARHYSFNVLTEVSEVSSVVGSKAKGQEGRLRAPVITLLGHVDHGKTTLLKAIKRDSTLIQEAGGITQSMGSYEIPIKSNSDISKLIFLDTPGHEAFVAMRRRGADITDLVILVVSADDGLKPQTIEAINHIQARNLPFIVAINKVDKLEANIAKVKQQLLEFNIGDIDSKGNNMIIELSAINGYNINLLVLTSLT